MAKKDNGGSTTTAIAKAESVQMAAGVDMPSDWLSDILGNDALEVTGTEEMDQSDVRLPAWLLNSKKEDKESGRQAPDDTFWNSITEKTKDKLRLVVLTNHKSRQWREEDPGTKEFTIRCSSWDAKTGTMASGTTRPCAGCPDYEWRTDANGKRSRRCTDVYNLISLDRETRDVCVVKVKKTAIKGFRLYYQEHFHKKRPAKVRDPKTGRERVAITDIPFFAAETIVEAEKKQGGGYTWYVPRFAFGGALPKEEILGAAELVKSYLGEYLERAAKTTDADVVDAIEATGEAIDSNEFRDDAGAASASDAGANRF